MATHKEVFSIFLLGARHKGNIQFLLLKQEAEVFIYNLHQSRQ